MGGEKKEGGEKEKPEGEKKKTGKKRKKPGKKKETTEKKKSLIVFGVRIFTSIFSTKGMPSTPLSLYFIAR